MYEIAKYLTLEERRRAADAKYEFVPGSHALRTRDGLCALAVAGGFSYSMGPGEFTRAITHDDSYASTRPVYDAAEQFMSDFDDGKITDVAKAMGVKRKTT